MYFVLIEVHLILVIFQGGTFTSGTLLFCLQRYLYVKYFPLFADRGTYMSNTLLFLQTEVPLLQVPFVPFFFFRSFLTFVFSPNVEEVKLDSIS
jgi:hypothetical protein